MSTNNFDAILLTSFGGPEGQDEVVPFLERVTAGRGIPAERLLEVGQHYVRLGGVSPINAQNRALLAALREALPARNINLPIYWGNRNSQPFFADVLKEIHAAGHRRVLALVTSAYSSYSGCRQYRENLAEALAVTGLGDELEIVKVRQYFDMPGFQAPMVDDLASALIRFSSQYSADEIRVFFTTHSIPTSMAETSGPDELREQNAAVGGTYVAQHLAVAEAIMAKVAAQAESAGAGNRTLPRWDLVYQSRSGSPHTPWLEPDINDALTEAQATGYRAAIVVPIGFISDHVEVIWDLDTQAAETAAGLGLDYYRVQTAGIDPRFVEGIADLLEEKLAAAVAANGGTAAGDAAATAGFCSTNCCLNQRASLPVIAGPAG